MKNLRAGAHLADVLPKPIGARTALSARFENGKKQSKHLHPTWIRADKAVRAPFSLGKTPPKMHPRDWATSLPNFQFNQLLHRGFRPATIGGGAGRTWM